MASEAGGVGAEGGAPPAEDLAARVRRLLRAVQQGEAWDKEQLDAALLQAGFLSESSRRYISQVLHTLVPGLEVGPVEQAGASNSQQQHVGDGAAEPVAQSSWSSGAGEPTAAQEQEQTLLGGGYALPLQEAAAEVNEAIRSLRGLALTAAGLEAPPARAPEQAPLDSGLGDERLGLLVSAAATAATRAVASALQPPARSPGRPVRASAVRLKPLRPPTAKQLSSGAAEPQLAAADQVSTAAEPAASTSAGQEAQPPPKPEGQQQPEPPSEPAVQRFELLREPSFAAASTTAAAQAAGGQAIAATGQGGPALTTQHPDQALEQPAVPLPAELRASVQRTLRRVEDPEPAVAQRASSQALEDQRLQRAAEAAKAAQRLLGSSFNYQAAAQELHGLQAQAKQLVGRLAGQPCSQARRGARSGAVAPAGDITDSVPPLVGLHARDDAWQDTEQFAQAVGQEVTWRIQAAAEELAAPAAAGAGAAAAAAPSRPAGLQHSPARRHAAAGAQGVGSPLRPTAAEAAADAAVQAQARQSPARQRPAGRPVQQPQPTKQRPNVAFGSRAEPLPAPAGGARSPGRAAGPAGGRAHVQALPRFAEPPAPAATRRTAGAPPPARAVRPYQAPARAARVARAGGAGLVPGMQVGAAAGVDEDVLLDLLLDALLQAQQQQAAATNGGAGAGEAAQAGGGQPEVQQPAAPRRRSFVRVTDWPERRTAVAAARTMPAQPAAAADLRSQQQLAAPPSGTGTSAAAGASQSAAWPPKPAKRRGSQQAGGAAPKDPAQVLEADVLEGLQDQVLGHLLQQSRPPQPEGVQGGPNAGEQQQLLQQAVLEELAAALDSWVAEAQQEQERRPPAAAAGATSQAQPAAAPVPFTMGGGSNQEQLDGALVELLVDALSLAVRSPLPEVPPPPHQQQPASRPLPPPQQQLKAGADGTGPAARRAASFGKVPGLQPVAAPQVRPGAVQALPPSTCNDDVAPQAALWQPLGDAGISRCGLHGSNVALHVADATGEPGSPLGLAGGVIPSAGGTLSAALALSPSPEPSAPPLPVADWVAASAGLGAPIVAGRPRVQTSLPSSDAFRDSVEWRQALQASVDGPPPPGSASSIDTPASTPARPAVRRVCLPPAHSAKVAEAMPLGPSAASMQGGQAGAGPASHWQPAPTAQPTDLQEPSSVGDVPDAPPAAPAVDASKEAARASAAPSAGSEQGDVLQAVDNLPPRRLWRPPPDKVWDPRISPVGRSGPASSSEWLDSTELSSLQPLGSSSGGASQAGSSSTTTLNTDSTPFSSLATPGTSSSLDTGSAANTPPAARRAALRALAAGRRSAQKRRAVVPGGGDDGSSSPSSSRASRLQAAM